MNLNELTLPDDAAEKIAEDIMRYGGEDVETGGFLLAPRNDNEIAIVALTGSVGIVRRSNLLQISDLALDRLFEFADTNDWWIPAQFHSHRLEAFLSPTDVEHGLSVKDFVTCVVPHFKSPSTDAAAWGWWRYENAWNAIPPPRKSTDPVSMVTFDEEGVLDA